MFPPFNFESSSHIILLLVNLSDVINSFNFLSYSFRCLWNMLTKRPTC